MGAQAADDEPHLGGPAARPACSRPAATARSTPTRCSRTAALRYASPFLHLIALGTNVALLGEGHVYAVTLAAQLALLAAAALGRVIPAWPLRIASYYVSVTASIAAGLIDRIRSGPATTWEPVEGTR